MQQQLVLGNVVKQAWMFITAIALCSLFGFSAVSVLSHQADNYAHSGTYVHSGTYAVSQDTSDSLAVVTAISTAVKFEHLKQFAKWQHVGISQAQLPVLTCDAHLTTEPITEPWFLFSSFSRFRLAGWKDASLQYKIKNAFI
jgi:hypothetical protein